MKKHKRKRKTADQTDE